MMVKRRTHMITARWCGTKHTRSSGTSRQQVQSRRTVHNGNHVSFDVYSIALVMIMSGETGMFYHQSTSSLVPFSYRLEHGQMAGTNVMCKPLTQGFACSQPSWARRNLRSWCRQLWSGNHTTNFLHQPSGMWFQAPCQMMWIWQARNFSLQPNWRQSLQGTFATTWCMQLRICPDPWQMASSKFQCPKEVLKDWGASSPLKQDYWLRTLCMVQNALLHIWRIQIGGTSPDP